MSKPSPRNGLEAALDQLPVFPLGQVVLFPRAILPLHIFEPRYRAMVKDVLETHGAMAIALITDPRIGDAHGHPPIAKVAGAGIIVEHQPHPDGRFNILLHGVARVRMEELPFVPPYRRAKATILEDTNVEVAVADRSALIASASAFATEVHKRDPNFSFRLPPNLDAGAIADLCAHHMVVDAHARQAILEELDVGRRVQLVIRELALQKAAFTVESGGAVN